MDRKVPFSECEYYHLYTRGVEKRIVFTAPRDYERFMWLLLVANQEKGVSIRDLERKYLSRGESSGLFFENERPVTPLTDILAYALMPNHVHLVVRERAEGGISRFMHKLMTAYSMYFNTRYERSGPLFTRPYRSKHLDTDEYLRAAIAYVHANPLALLQHDGSTADATDEQRERFLNDYLYSSYADRSEEMRPESHIVAHGARAHVLDIATLRDIPTLHTHAAAYEDAPAIL